MPPLRNKRALLRRHIHIILRYSLLIWMFISHMATSSSKGSKIYLFRPMCMIEKDGCHQSAVPWWNRSNRKRLSISFLLSLHRKQPAPSTETHLKCSWTSEGLEQHGPASQNKDLPGCSRMDPPSPDKGFRKLSAGRTTETKFIRA